MQFYHKLPICVLFIVFSFFSCLKKEKNKEKGINKKEYRIQEKEVAITVLKKKAFQKEIVSNGKLRSFKKSTLTFKVTDQLEKVFVKNGDFVEKGKLLAYIKPFKFQQNLEKAKLTFKKAELDLKDQLLGRDYELSNKADIPKEIYEMVSIRSGYADAKRNIATAKENLESTKLLAPFKGKIASLNYKQYELVSAGRDFLTLINDDIFEVEFFLIESEISDVQIDDLVSVVPFALKTSYKGKVTSINAEVAKNGTVLVKASIKNDGKLLEGMNVKVFIQKDIPNQYVVPKSAVVLRQNQEVLFRVVNNRAFWTYVLTTNENSNSYAVIPHPDKNSAILQLGDSIITSNNLNLAHDTAVKIKSNK